MYPDLPLNSLLIPLHLNFLDATFLTFRQAELSFYLSIFLSFYPSSNRVYCLCIEPRISRKILLYFRKHELFSARARYYKFNS